MPARHSLGGLNSAPYETVKTNFVRPRSDIRCGVQKVEDIVLGQVQGVEGLN